MPYTVTYLAEAAVVETVYAGDLDARAIDAAVEATAACASEHDCRRFLADCRDLAPGGRVIDIWALAEFLAGFPPGSIEREAVLVPGSPQAASELGFFETAARNRGLDVRLFLHRDEALAWLTG